MISEDLLSILACPKCKGPIVYVSEEKSKNQYLDCAKCRLRYAIQEDIPIMLIEKAETY